MIVEDWKCDSLYLGTGENVTL